MRSSRIYQEIGMTKKEALVFIREVNQYTRRNWKEYNDYRSGLSPSAIKQLDGNRKKKRVKQ